MSSAFLTSGIATSSAITIQKNEIGEQGGTLSEIAPLTKTVTLYRHGIGGSVSPVEVTIELDDCKDIEDVIADKCEKLLENDEEIQNFLKESNSNVRFFCKVKSKGRGFHYQTLLLEKLLVRYLLFRLNLPRIHTLLNKPLVLCRYKKDPKANTTITSLIFQNTKRYMEGKHMVIAIYFLGFTSWWRRFSFSPLDILPRAFVGFANLAICRSL